MFFEFYASLTICKPIFYEKSLKMYCFFSLSAMKLLVNHLFGSASSSKNKQHYQANQTANDGFHHPFLGFNTALFAYPLIRWQSVLKNLAMSVLSYIPMFFDIPCKHVVMSLLLCRHKTLVC